jgi:hypothetical protein
MRGPDELLLRELRCALETLFGAGAAHDLLALPEAESCLLGAKHLPQLLQARVEIPDLVLYGRVEALGEASVQLLALLRDLLDLGMNLVRCHAD